MQCPRVLHLTTSYTTPACLPHPQTSQQNVVCSIYGIVFGINVFIFELRHFLSSCAFDHFLPPCLWLMCIWVGACNGYSRCNTSPTLYQVIEMSFIGRWGVTFRCQCRLLLVSSYTLFLLVLREKIRILFLIVFSCCLLIKFEMC